MHIVFLAAHWAGALCTTKLHFYQPANSSYEPQCFIHLRTMASRSKEKSLGENENETTWPATILIIVTEKNSENLFSVRFNTLALNNNNTSNTFFTTFKKKD